MDIHRCRFVEYPPSTINAVAFSHPSCLTSRVEAFPTLRLAIGRANGDLEIWNPLQGAWFQESILRGGKDRSIEGLAWTQDPDDFDKHGSTVAGKIRLFSIGYSTVVTEWNLALGKPLRHSTGNFGEIWCIAAQPTAQLSRNGSSKNSNDPSYNVSSRQQNVVAGCADGAIVLFTTADGNLQFLRTLIRPSKKKARVLSIIYQNRDVLVAGYADSTIRVFDTRNGHLIRSMSLGVGPIGGPKEILVWSIKCLLDGTIVSGDSTGTLRLWNGQNYTLLQRIKSHVADILDVATSADGETVISGGMDRRTTFYRRIGTGESGNRRQWAELMHRRMHKHDVKALATFEAKYFSVMVSGGLDTNPIITPIERYGKENHRTITGLPLQPCVGGASGARLLMSWWAGEIRIWWIPRYGDFQYHAGNESDAQIQPQTRKLVAKILIQGEESVLFADLTSDGRILAVCTMSGVKLFRLRPKESKALKVSAIEVPVNVRAVGAKMVKFSPDGKWLVLIRTDNSIQICRINGEGGTRDGPLILPRCIILKRLSRPSIHIEVEFGSLGKYERTINRVAFSADSRILVVGDLSGYLDSWVLEGHEDLMQGNEKDTASAKSSDDQTTDEESHPQVILGQHWIRNPAASLIPKLSATALILSFRPSTAKSTKQSNGPTVVHPTRSTPHPHSHDLPQGEDRLFAFTSEHQMYEFNVLSGRLSDWSRRNPSSSLPGGFRGIHDRAMGSIWDIKGSKERIWLYGSSWLYMFDLSLDLPTMAGSGKKGMDNALPSDVQEAKPLKRKRNLSTSNRTFSIGIGRKYRKREGSTAENKGWINMDLEQSQTSDDEDDYEDNGMTDETALLNLRRVSSHQEKNSNHLSELSEETTAITRSANSESNSGHTKGGKTKFPSWWGTHNYRDILGIVPLADGYEYCGEGVEPNGYDGEPAHRIEVALVERPMWEVDLPPRYDGNQEWDDNA